MKRLPFCAFVAFFVLLYSQGVCHRIGVPRLVVDGTLLALPLVALWSQGGLFCRPAPGFLFIWSYLGWSLSACIHNDDGVLRGLLYPRFLIVSYFVFWAAWRSQFTRRQLLWINQVIFAMFFVQVAAALFYGLVLDQKIEAVVGTMGYQTGGIATTFPMFAFSCMLAFFLYYNRPTFLIAGFLFFLVGYASGKLAVYYFIPLILIVGLALYAIQEGLPVAIQRSRVVVLVAAGALPLLVFLLSHTYRVESLQQEAGLYNKIVSFVGHTRGATRESEPWYTTTRSGTSRRVLEETFRRAPAVFLFGQSTRVLLDTSGRPDQRTYDNYGILYGLVGWSADALAVGWPAAFAHLGFYTYLFFCLLRSKSRTTPDPYWKAIRLMVQLGFCVFLISYFLYSIHFTTGGWLSSVYLYWLAVLLAPQYQEMLCIHPTVFHPSAARDAWGTDWREAPYGSSWPKPTTL